MKNTISAAYILCLLFGFSTVNAQLNISSQNDVNVQISPDNPKPFGGVSISLESYSLDINAAEISWTINGKMMKKGFGEKVYSFSVGDIYTKIFVDIGIRTNDGIFIRKSLSIKPTAVDLIWETVGFTPPFYKGRTLFSHQNSITFTAIPHITNSDNSEIGAKNLIYKWKKDGSVLDSNSGYGKNSITITGSIISRPIDIEVEVSTKDNDGFGHARSVVAPTDPTILLYEKNPIYGIQFQKTLTGNLLLNEPEVAVIAMPYFFGIKYMTSPEISYKWQINGVNIDGDVSQTTRVFRQLEGASGFAKISISIENSKKILQYASRLVTIGFGSIKANQIPSL